MNQCKYCGKEIPKGRKFCNSSCAAIYNNTHRTRKPWTEEQKKAIRKPKEQRYCKYCGKELEKGQVCKGCKQYSKNIRFITKLTNINVQEPLQDAFFRALGRLSFLYFSEKLSTTEIYRKTGLAANEVGRYLKDLQQFCRSNSGAQKLQFEQGKRKVITAKDYKKYRKSKHFTWEGIEVFLRSSYELDFAKELDRQRIPYLVEPFQIRYISSVDKKYHTALPDFYLPKTNEMVEIKSNWTFKGREQEMKDKFEAYKALGYTPKLILEHKEVNLL